MPRQSLENKIFTHQGGAAFTETDVEALKTTEWLVTNGLGGYACGTVGGVITRRFHGYLVAALPSPLGRTMMLNDLVEQVILPDGRMVQLGGEERARIPLQLHGADFLSEFRLDVGLPAWRYQVGEFVLEKRLMLPHGYWRQLPKHGAAGCRRKLSRIAHLSSRQKVLRLPTSSGR